MALLSKEREGEREGFRSSEGRSGDLSVITKDVRIVGDVETAGRLRLEGAVTGNVRARSIELAATGSVEGDVVMLDPQNGKETFAIDGTVQGAVRAGQVEVGQGGSVLGGIEADHATVSGRVQGGIQARDRLALRATAVVEGDIDARRLALEEGGQVNGNIRIGDRAALAESGRTKGAGEKKGAESGAARTAEKKGDSAKGSGTEEARASA
jgi:cytoskeletal protein CcmA (bactofilin family)